MFKFSTKNLQEVFAEEGKYEGFRSVASNLIRGNAIFELDDNGNERQVSKRQANEAIRKVFMEVCGLSEEDLKSRKKRERAERAHAVEIYEIIEEDIDFRINEGFQESEWFNEFVEYRNLALGDANEFVAADNSYLLVMDVSGDNHDLTMQQLGEGKPYMAKVAAHAVKIGKDIDLIILGRVDYTRMVEKVAEAFVNDVQNEVYTAFYAASDKLPAGNTFKKSGALSASTKANFDELIENVEVVNNAAVVIIGTKVALKKITALADVNWASSDQKDSIANTGRLGSYEGTILIEVPQRLKVGANIGSLAATDKLIPNDKLLIMPVTEDKFVKFVDEGETEIFEVTQKGELVDDFQTYEVQRRYGTTTVLGQYFGEWTIE